MLRLFVTSRPGCGKTTLLWRVATHFPTMVAGFLTHEVRQEGKRVGFSITPLSPYDGTCPIDDLPGKLFASVDFRSPVRVGKYGVDVAGFEEVAVAELEKALNSEKPLLIIDEIGKMELASRAFCDLLNRILSSEKVVLASVHAHRHPITDRLKTRPDILIWELTQANREKLFERVLDVVCGGLGFTTRPVGLLKTPWRTAEEAPRQPVPAEAAIFLLPPYIEAACQLKPHDTIDILWLAHKAARTTRSNRPDKRGGVFSLRSPNRPNPIALSTARVLRVCGNRIAIDRADAINDSPLLDIKPHLKDAPHA